MALFIPAAPSEMRTLSSRSRASLKAVTASGDFEVIVTSVVLADAIATQSPRTRVASPDANRDIGFLMDSTFPGAARGLEPVRETDTGDDPRCPVGRLPI